MKAQSGRDVRDQIQELRAIIHLQEQGKSLFNQSSQQRLSQNRDIIGFLQSSVRQRANDWEVARKHDEKTISWAFREQRILKLATCGTSVEAVLEKLRKYIFDRVRVHNALVHLLRRRAAVLEGLRRELRTLRRLESSSQAALLQHRKIRQLENNIEKMTIKNTTGRNIHLLYKHFLGFLKQELAAYPSQLDGMENMVFAYEGALQDMTQMAQEAIEVTEAAKVNMTEMETAFIAERRARESQLSTQKKQIDRIRLRDAGDRHRRSRRDTDFSLAGEEPAKGKKLEPSKSQLEYEAQVTSEVEKVKNAVQCSNLWDITGRFLAQRTSEENLVQQTAECRQKRKELKAFLRQLDLERAELKFHQTPGSISSRQMEERMRQSLEAEEARLERVNYSVAKNQELLLTIQNGIDNLFVRLWGISVPGEEDVSADFTDAFDKLEFCQRKLVHLVGVSKDVSMEENDKVKRLLEKSTQEEKLNLKISFEDQDADATETFEFADVDNSYVPSREEIKKQSENLIEAKLKAIKKKQKK
ncbi:coiled-coil domain-containing protein 183 [Tachyglossus aculeatus]|uniref:coiled-coil domain-containing protein 183 n=1 Tax=Tachyglossus aculeatus TaxID=9261 RepID=UPI0018F7AE11|nr:coiled-coil domain-containing protein 183 [Tachyglossus aculeatus]